MQVLEKMLQEIEEFKKKKFDIVQPMHSDKLGIWVCDQIEDIIRSHMEDNGWIPWDGKNLPPEGELVEVTIKPKILKTPRRDIGYYDRDREEWWQHDDDGLLDVIAWKIPSEPYQPEKGGTA